MRRHWARWLFAIPVFCAVWAPLYARTTPRLGPFPFVIWFQFATVVIGSLVAWVAYLADRGKP
ncbi:MAG TPA: DUF3311 domain-containing protein [Acidimicrobiales bacterium]|nr:DUF3311 domain-containing protein [Acidimicrobiales bacterium]